MNSHIAGPVNDAIDNILSSNTTIGILLAIVSAAALTLGNYYQSRGVARRQEERGSGSPTLGPAEFWALFRTPIWLFGGVLFGVSIAVQLASYAFAPLIVVQPVGVIALVFASMLTAFVTKSKPSRAEVISIAISVVSLTIFVAVAAAVSTQTAITDAQLIAILIVLGVSLVITFVPIVMRGFKRLPPIFFVALGGVYAGFVASLGKTVILRVQTAWDHRSFELDDTNLLTIACIVGVIVAGGLSVVFVQTAHTVANPQTVVAGLTVIDPALAVVIGITVLNEAAHAPWWSFVVFVVAGAGAVWGVWKLSVAQTEHQHERDPGGESGIEAADAAGAGALGASAAAPAGETVERRIEQRLKRDVDRLEHPDRD